MTAQGSVKLRKKRIILLIKGQRMEELKDKRQQVCVVGLLGEGHVLLKKKIEQNEYKMHKRVFCRHQSLCLLFPLTEVNLFLHLKNYIVVYLV